MDMEWLKRKLGNTLAYRLARKIKHLLLLSASAHVGQNAQYDVQTIEVMRRILRHDSICIDVGAHRGSILRHMIEISPNGKHYAFEPLPHLALELKKQFPEVNIHQVAISNISGESEFQHVLNAPAYSGLRRRIYDRSDPKITTIQVSTRTLDEIIPATEQIAFVKIDIEGGEYHAIKGGTNTFLSSLPVIVFEAGRKSTGQYEVSADDLYFLLTGDLHYNLSTMRRWLDGAPGFTRREFERNWIEGPDFYFIAVPKVDQPTAARDV